MNDETQDVAARGGGDSAALGIAMNAHAATAEEARAYLREQTELARLQKQNLVEQNAFEMSHLRWRRFIEQVRGTGYAMLVLAGFALLVAAGAAVWSAANDRGLVVESFSVPAELSNRGETGAVIAQHVLDRVAAMQAGVVSVRAAGTYSNNWGDELKVQIPDTGISLAEAYRYLARWLGHQTHITGEVVRSDNAFTVTARVGAAPGRAFTGANVDTLLDKVAEHVFAETQPYRYGLFLYGHGRNAEGDRVLLNLARSDVSPTERAWAFAGLMYGSYGSGDNRAVENYGRAAIGLDPGIALVHNNLAGAANRLGHSELAYREAAEAARLFRSGGGELDPRAVSTQQSTTLEEADAGIGDYLSAIGEMRGELQTDWGVFRDRSKAFLARDLAAAHELTAARNVIRSLNHGSAAGALSSQQQMLVTYLALGQIELTGGEWTKARRDLGADLPKLNPGSRSAALSAEFVLATAESGDIAEARALAAKFSADCYPCLEARGEIETAARNWLRAGALFAEAVRQGPSLPFAYMQWGQMLMAKGDYAVAIAKFALANQKGPHFADPLEMWGEALIAKNRSDLARAKFEEANKYAPNWGRLHLKWGEALYWRGDKAGAQKQFAAAAALDLSASDKSELARMSTGHG